MKDLPREGSEDNMKVVDGAVEDDEADADDADEPEDDCGDDDEDD